MLKKEWNRVIAKSINRNQWIVNSPLRKLPTIILVPPSTSDQPIRSSCCCRYFCCKSVDRADLSSIYCRCLVFNNCTGTYFILLLIALILFIIVTITIVIIRFTHI
jgi:hypothetical protein